MFQYTRIFADESTNPTDIWNGGANKRADRIKATDEMAGQIAAAARRLLQETGMNQRELAVNAKLAYADLTAFMQKPAAGVQVGLTTTVEKELDKYLGKKASDLEAGKLNDFVETPVSEAIFGVVDYLMSQDEAGISVVRMDTGVGKSVAVAAKMREVPGCVYLSVSVATRSLKGFLEDIGRKVGRRFSANDSIPNVKDGVVSALRHHQLLIVDEFHQLTQRKCDDCIQMLSEFTKEHGIRQAWISTMSISRYIDKRANRWGNLLSQIRRHFCPGCDSDDLRDAHGAIFKRVHIAKMLAGGRLGLDDEAMKYMVTIANMPQEGGLGLMKKVYPVAVGMAVATGAATITRDILRAALTRIGSGAMRQIVETTLARESTAPAATAKRMVG